jgi:hypothetical protein
MNTTKNEPVTRLMMVKSLGAAKAPRIADPGELIAWFEQQGLSIATITLKMALPSLCEAGALLRVRHGVYLNKMATPTPMTDEIAQRLRSGAVISLHRVLGRCGVLNNPTEWITSVIPRSTTRSGGGLIKTELSTFTFNVMKDEFFAEAGSGWERDALAPFTKVPVATAEKALLDWLYLSNSKTSSKLRAPPAHDVDMSSLDQARLGRLAKRMGLEEVLADFSEKVAAANKEADEHVVVLNPRPLKR